MSVSSSVTAPSGRLGRVLLDVAGLVDVFELVRQAVEVADDLGEHAAADLVFEGVGGDFDECAAGAAQRERARCGEGGNGADNCDDEFHRRDYRGSTGELPVCNCNGGSRRLDPPYGLVCRLSAAQLIGL